MIIAIDGTAASGKGTLGRTLAMRLHFDYLDTGQLYRAVGYFALAKGLDLDVSAPKEIAKRKIILKNFEKMIDKNFDNTEEMKTLIDGVKSDSTKMQLIFPSYRMLKT